ncbi:MAG: YggS family pyridoxal phosphate-dependent enzyme [Thermodesulfobacteriota bacterium]
MGIKENIEDIQKIIESACSETKRDSRKVKLIAVSKTKPASDIKKAFEAGQKDFGENYIQEAMDKIDEIGKDGINWHFIGRLQSNKAKFAVKYFDYIHSVDSLKLAKEISKRASLENKTQKILIQINTGKEEQKSGIMPESAAEFFETASKLENIEILGLMAIPPFGMPEKETEKHFILLKNTLDDLNNKFPKLKMSQLSMGMSGDYTAAIKQGATMVRIGTAVFGERK